jgi:hypothetical protein
MPIEQFPTRPSLVRRHDLIKTEPIKPKRSYYDYKKEDGSETTIENISITDGSKPRRRKRRSLRNTIDEPSSSTAKATRRRRRLKIKRSTSSKTSEVKDTPIPKLILEKPKKKEVDRSKE